MTDAETPAMPLRKYPRRQCFVTIIWADSAARMPPRRTGTTKAPPWALAPITIRAASHSNHFFDSGPSRSRNSQTAAGTTISVTSSGLRKNRGRAPTTQSTANTSADGRRQPTPLCDEEQEKSQDADGEGAGDDQSRCTAEPVYQSGANLEEPLVVDPRGPSRGQGKWIRAEKCAVIEDPSAAGEVPADRGVGNFEGADDRPGHDRAELPSIESRRSQSRFSVAVV